MDLDGDPDEELSMRGSTITVERGKEEVSATFDVGMWFIQQRYITAEYQKYDAGEEAFLDKISNMYTEE